MPFYQNAFRKRMDFPMTRIAERNKVVKAVVPVGFEFPETLPVNVMDVEGVCTPTMTTSEPITLQGVEVVNVPMLADELCQKRTLFGAIKLVQSRSGVCGVTYHASKNAAAGFAVLLMVALNRVKQFATFGALFCVELWLTFFVLPLTCFASNLQRVVGIKNFTTFTRSSFNGFFHKPIVSSLGVLNNG